METIKIKCKGAATAKLDELIPFQGDLKELTEENYEKLKKTILRQGFSEPISIWEHEGKKNMLNGHQRHTTLVRMEKEGYKVPAIPVSLIQADSLKQAKEKVLTLTSQYGQITRKGYQNFIDQNEIEIEFAAEHLRLVEVDVVDITEPDKPSARDKKEDEVPELAPDPITKKGDIWILGNHRLMCGDSIIISDVEKLMDDEKADMVFTDPPYGINFQSHFRKKAKFDVLKNDDRLLDFIPSLEIATKNDTPWFIWTSHHVYYKWREMYDKYYKSTIIWKKNGGTMGDLKGNYSTNYEMALFCAKGRPVFINNRPPAVWEIGKDNVNEYLHPTQKPVELAEHAMGNFLKSETMVLDLFLGSGSTLIACEKTKRKCYGMELDERYCDVIIRRWQGYSKKSAILERTKQKYNDLVKIKK